MIVKLGSLGYNNLRKSGDSKYKHVYIYKLRDSGKIVYKVSISRYNWVNLYLSEREAGIAVDIKLIENGLKPVNILKKKI